VRRRRAIGASGSRAVRPHRYTNGNEDTPAGRAADARLDIQFSKSAGDRGSCEVRVPTHIVGDEACAGRWLKAADST